MKKFTVDTNFGSYENCTYMQRQYGNKHIAIQLYCEEGPLATLTVNIDGIENFPKNYSCVDTNNCPWAEPLIEKLGLGEWAGAYLNSGYCMYPVYKFNV